MSELLKKTVNYEKLFKMSAISIMYNSPIISLVGSNVQNVI